MTGTVGEVPIFLGAVYGGLVIGLTFTAFRVLHALFGGGRISDALLDALFYLLSGVIAALTLFRINGGYGALETLHRPPVYPVAKTVEVEQWEHHPVWCFLYPVLYEIG